MLDPIFTPFIEKSSESAFQGYRHCHTASIVLSLLVSVTVIPAFMHFIYRNSMSMIADGFIPSALRHVTEYIPSLHELFISACVTAIGAFILTVFFKIAISIKVYTASGEGC